MPPKRKLPRREAAADGEPNLESVAEERIDAITAEPLHPVKFVEISSPDQSLRLFYNTSSLIRIATEKGRFMQPPHFREPMDHLLQKRIEEVEGRAFHFKSQDVIYPAIGSGEDDANGLHVMHRHVYFEQIMDEFYHVSQAEVYVCPLCYQHYLTSRYVPSLEAVGRSVEYANNGETIVVDPLDVLSHMRGVNTGTDEEVVVEEGGNTPLVHIVFRRAVQWKRHMLLHHDVDGVVANDYRLRDVLCAYYSAFNSLRAEQYEAKRKVMKDAKKQVSMTQQRYWQINARYNRLRYNRVVEVVEEAEENNSVVETSAFPGERIALSFNPVVDDESDFIDDDQSEEDEYLPHYLPQFDNENEGESEPLPTRRRAGRRRSRSSTVDSSSESSTTCTTSNTVSQSASTNPSQGKEDLYRCGLLAPIVGLDERMSAEDRLFVEASSRRKHTPSHLYDPVMYSRPGRSNVEEDPIDWENIGDVLIPSSASNRLSAPQPGAGIASSKEQHRGDGGAGKFDGSLQEGKPPFTVSSQISEPQPRLLLDDDEA